MRPQMHCHPLDLRGTRKSQIGKSVSVYESARMCCACMHWGAAMFQSALTNSYKIEIIKNI